MEREIKILVVEDDESDYEWAHRALSRMSLHDVKIKEVYGSSSLNEAMRSIEKHSPDILLMDLSLPDTVGMSGIVDVLEKYHDLPIVILTGRDDEPSAIEAMRSGAQDYLIKGTDEKTLTRSIRYALERSEIYRKLAIAEKAAVDASKAKSTFLSNMSHEIRTPLTAIIGYSEALSVGYLTEEQKESAYNAVLTNGRHLLDVVNDILDFSKIEAKKIELEVASLDLKDLYSDILNLFSHRVMERGIELNFTFGQRLPESIDTDKVRLKQILFNLISNAIKFTHKGAVTIHTEFNEGTNILTFSVEDTGIGIPREQQDRLFNAFTQADTSTTRQFGGTGLGLVISQQLAHLLCGEVSFESTEGKGSTFSVKLHCSKIKGVFKTASFELSQNSPLLKVDFNHGFKGKVLVTDDSEYNRAILTVFLEKLGLEVSHACNGLEAIEKVENEDSFNLVLMDIQMPIMDGYEATKVICGLKPELPVIAVTASVMGTDDDHFSSKGFKDLLPKPFMHDELYRLLDKYLEPGELLLVESETIIPDDSMSKLIRDYVLNLPGRQAELHSAVDRGDMPTLRLEAHKLIGAGLFGFYRLGSLAWLLEMLVAQSEENDKESSPLELVLTKIDAQCEQLYREHGLSGKTIL